MVDVVRVEHAAVRSVVVVALAGVDAGLRVVAPVTAVELTREARGGDIVRLTVDLAERDVGDVPARIGECGADLALGGDVFALAEVLVAQLAVGSDQILRRPESILEDVQVA
jgi:hypothetical protein